jgi:hypothetical protein
MNIYLNPRQARLIELILENERMILFNKLNIIEDEDLILDVKIEISDIDTILGRISQKSQRRQDHGKNDSKH